MKNAHHYSDQGNANKNQNEVLLYSYQDSYTFEERKIASVGKNLEKLKPSYMLMEI